MSRRTRLLAVLATTVTITLAILATRASAADTQLLLVHGYADSRTGTDCDGGTWKNALAYYQHAGGRARSSMSTIATTPATRDAATP